MKKEDFYEGGKFNKAKALEAYYDLMRRFHYPIYAVLKTDQFWTSDFAQNDFLNVGMAGIFWINNTEAGYFGHEIYLPWPGLHLRRRRTHAGSPRRPAGIPAQGERHHRQELQNLEGRRSRVLEPFDRQALHDRRSRGRDRHRVRHAPLWARAGVHQQNRGFLNKVHVTDVADSAHKIEWLRFEAGSPMPELLQTTAHIAYQVDDMASALQGKKVLVAPFHPMDGVTVAFIVEEGAPIELMHVAK